MPGVHQQLPRKAESQTGHFEHPVYGQMFKHPVYGYKVKHPVYGYMFKHPVYGFKFKHPVYGDINSPVHGKVKAFHEGGREFRELVNRHRPKYVFNSDIVFSTMTYFRQHMDYEKYIAGQWFGNHYALLGMTSRGGALAQLTGRNNPYPGKLGVIEPGAYADILVVDGNPLEDLSAIGADPGWFNATPRSDDVKPIRVIMKDGKVYKNTL